MTKSQPLIHNNTELFHAYLYVPTLFIELNRINFMQLNQMRSVTEAAEMVNLEEMPHSQKITKHSKPYSQQSDKPSKQRDNHKDERRNQREMLSTFSVKERTKVRRRRLTASAEYLPITDTLRREGTRADVREQRVQTAVREDREDSCTQGRKWEENCEN